MIGGRKNPAAARLVAFLCVAVVLGAACSASDPTSAPGEVLQTERTGWFQTVCDMPAEWFRKIYRGYNPKRSPEIATLPLKPNFYGSFVNTTHSGPWDYVQQIPMVLYGPGFIRSNGEITGGREKTMADVAPTIARLFKTKWPSDRPGQPLNAALRPAAERRRPKLMVVVVWDGGGRNVLDRWDGRWPRLERFSEEGTSFFNTTTGATQSNTPVVHSTLGTGVWPRRHGIIDINIRVGDDVVDSFKRKGGRYLETSTIGDIYDRATNNRAKIGMFAYHPWQQGMAGHGSAWPGADADDAALVSHGGEGVTRLANFNFPAYAASTPGLEADTRSVDAGDGKRDGRWRDNNLDSSRALKDSPVYLLYQTRVVKQMIAREGYGADRIPDLFLVNYKPIDTIGHAFNMTSPESGDSIEYADRELGRLRRFLDRTIGKKQWVMLITADHGQTPAARPRGVWPVYMPELTKDVAEYVGRPQPDLVDEKRAGYLWIDREELRKSDRTLSDIADFLTNYRLRANVPDGENVPRGYEDRTDERILAAAWPTYQTERIADCIFRD